MTPEERLTRLETLIEGQADTIGGLAQDMRAVGETLAQAKGGWKTLMLVAGAAGTAGALAVKLTGIAWLAK
jgi:shikimate 5-dehydrogenase